MGFSTTEWGGSGRTEHVVAGDPLEILQHLAGPGRAGVSPDHRHAVLFVLAVDDQHLDLNPGHEGSPVASMAFSSDR